MTETTVHEIAAGVYRLSTFVPQIGPTGFTFNQFLVDGDEPLLFHTGGRGLFPGVAEAVARVLPVERLRWVSFGHVESDECGSMNQWLAAAPQSQVVFNGLGCDISLNDMADRMPKAMGDGEVLDTGGHRLRFVATPHVPHGWEAQVLFDETTGTLLAGDLFTHLGNPPALVHDADIVAAALEAEDLFGSTSLAPSTAPTIRKLASLAPRTLALMHGSSYAGDAAAALDALAESYAARLDAALEPVAVP